MPSARAIAIELEKPQGVHLPEKSPATTPRALGYRVMAPVLELTLGDAMNWLTSESRGGPLDPQCVVTKERLQDWEDTRWILVRDNVPVATADDFGWLEIDGRLLDLYCRYRELDGRLHHQCFRASAV